MCMLLVRLLQVTMEADPGTFDQQRLQEEMELGMNRIRESTICCLSKIL